MQINAQDRLCSCCTYETLSFSEDFEKWFPPSEIVKNKIKSVTIYTTSRLSQPGNDTSFKIINPEYREMILKFNDKGYLFERIYFNRLGKFHSINEFERDKDNRILTKTFFYLDDSTGVKDETFLPEKWIYSYHNGLLTKLKQLGDKFVDIEDNKTEYTSFKYDTQSRLIQTIHSTYYDGHPRYIFKSKTRYDAKKNTKTTITTHRGRIISKEFSNCDSKQDPTFTSIQDGKNKKIGSRLYEYNSNGLLISIENKNSGTFTECPDGGNLIERYSYSDSNLLIRIDHYYKLTLCSLRFKFE